MSVTYDSLSVTVKHRIGTTDTIADAGIGNLMKATKAVQEFLHYVDVEVADSPLKLVPFHAIEYVTVEAERTNTDVTDDTCAVDCNIMEDPTLTVPDTAIEVDAGAEFDPLLGVTALDSYNHRITPTVEIKASHLQNEDSIDISDENDDPLTVL